MSLKNFGSIKSAGKIVVEQKIYFGKEIRLRLRNLWFNRETMRSLKTPLCHKFSSMTQQCPQASFAPFWPKNDALALKGVECLQSRKTKATMKLCFHLLPVKNDLWSKNARNIFAHQLSKR